uniref:Uncharacterized protein n=1 Tax=Wuchereria bancrofti TaxID=6293 RepID=A0A1I8EGB0_WUCBA
MEVIRRNDSFYSYYGQCRILNVQRSKKIFIAIRRSDDRYVALKVEEISNREIEAASQYKKRRKNNLKHEHAVYRSLHGRESTTRSLVWNN